MKGKVKRNNREVELNTRVGGGGGVNGIFKDIPKPNSDTNTLEEKKNFDGIVAVLNEMQIKKNKEV